ncbi:MAG: hypothetical protein WAV48_06725 [Candidatus Magasanikiibacteriota bacterium]
MTGPRELKHAEIERRIAKLPRGRIYVDPGGTTDPALELRARATLESQRGAAYDELEWAEAKSNLFEFFAVLAEWNGVTAR